jgi:hypothetical protein
MKQHRDYIRRTNLRRCALVLVLLGLISAPLRACTVFVLTDTNRVLFCNNEDWSNPKARIWFVPADTNHYGCVYVGFDEGFAQGGMNTEGLASDWVAGSKEPWNPDPALPTSAGNRQLLESCATVEQAIAFFRGHRELGFYTARVLVADRTGASAIIGAKDGKLQVEKSNHYRGFGYGRQTLDVMLELQSSEPTVTNGVSILRACLQKGHFATKYSNVFDLKSGDIFLLPFPDRDDHQVRFNLATELKKGGHYYDMPDIHEQVVQAPRPLLANMERSLLDKYQPIPDKEPQVTAHVRAIWQDVLDDKMRAEDYTAESWKEASANRKLADATIKSLGRLVSLTLVDRSDENGKRCYRYRLEFEKNTVLQRYVFDEKSRVASGSTEDIR